MLIIRYLKKTSVNPIEISIEKMIKNKNVFDNSSEIFVKDENSKNKKQSIISDVNNHILENSIETEAKDNLTKIFIDKKNSIDLDKYLLEDFYLIEFVPVEKNSVKIINIGSNFENNYSKINGEVVPRKKSVIKNDFTDKISTKPNLKNNTNPNINIPIKICKKSGPKSKKNIIEKLTEEPISKIYDQNKLIRSNNLVNTLIGNFKLDNGKEIFKEIMEFPGNYVLNFGRLFRKNNTIFNKNRNVHGEHRITFMENLFPLNKLIATTFGKFPKGNMDCICYIDHNPKNNNIENIIFGTSIDREKSWNILRQKFLKETNGIEDLKYLDEYPNYAFSKFGYYINLKNNKVFFPTYTAGKYFILQFTEKVKLNTKNNTKVNKLYFHEIIAKLFLPNYSPDKKIVFLNGDTLDVRLNNLAFNSDEIALKIYKEEGWKTIDIFPKYEINFFGEIRNKGENNIHSNHNRIIGETKFNLMALTNSENQASWIYIDKLVALAFIENTANIENLKIIHKDGDPTNNHYTNLECYNSLENNTRPKNCAEALDRYENVINKQISSSEIGENTENYIKDLLSNYYPKVEGTSFGDKFDIKVTLENGIVKGIQIKTLTHNISKNLYYFNCNEYTDDTMIVGVNKSRDFFIIMFALNLPNYNGVVRFPITQVNDLKYDQFRCENKEDFLERFQNEIINSANYVLDLPKTVKKEYDSMITLQNFFANFQIEYKRNLSNANEIDGFINGIKINQ